MMKTKVLASLLLVLAVLFMQVGNVVAAPQTQDTTPITGTIQSITTEVEANGTTIILVTLLDSQGATQTVRVSVDTAVTLGLVTVDPATQKPVVDETKVGQTVSIEPTAAIPEGSTEGLHPIAAILGDFFHTDPTIINGLHKDGFGFGVIAQALYMSQALNGDVALAGAILQAKKSGNFSQFSQYFDPNSTPTNWGQFKKALRDGKQNLGNIVSGHANDENTPNEHGKGKDNGQGKGKDKKNNP